MKPLSFRKKAALVLFAVLIGAALCSCAQKNARTPALRLGVMYSSDIVPLAVMRDRELDAKHGVALDMQVFSSARDRDAALQAGELDGVFTDFVGICVYRGAGLDLKITSVTDGDYLLLAGRDSGVASLQDARGAGVAISENTLIEYALDYILAQNGLESGYLQNQIVPRIPDRLEMLRGGQVELCLLPEPFATLAAADGAARLSSANECGLYPAVCAFTQSALDEKREAIMHLYDGYHEAVDYINATPVEQYEDSVIQGAGFPEELRGKIELPVYRKRELPARADLQNAIAWAAQRGLCGGGLLAEDLLADLD